jgi:hypothetical protein
MAQRRRSIRLPLILYHHAPDLFIRNANSGLNFGSPKEFVGEFRPPITPAMVAMNICKGKVTIAALSGFADLAFANIHG